MKKFIKLSAATLAALTLVGAASPVVSANSNNPKFNLSVPKNASKVFENNGNPVKYQVDKNAWSSGGAIFAR